MPQIPRSPVDLTHYSAQAGQIGRLATITQIPVIPGDGMEIDVTGAFRLSPLRRGMVMDCAIDLAAFYVPHRYIYDNWVDFIEEGTDTTQILQTVALNAETSHFGHRQTGLVPKYLTQGYIDIYNRYYRPVTTIPEVTTITEANDRIWGLKCAKLKRAWNTGVNNNLQPSDYQVDVVGGKLDLRDFQLQQGVLQTEIEREWFNQRYADIIKNAGGYTEEGADQRPKMLMRSKIWASGYDVDGTGNSSLGQFSGRVTQAFNFKIPRYYVPEHGTIWVMALLRFPPVNQHEISYFEAQQTPSYDDISGDVGIYMSKQPESYDASDFFLNGANNSLGYMPYGWWYREQPNQIHRQFINLTGFPFEDNIPANVQQAVLVDPPDYENMFQTTQLGHWNMQARVNAVAQRRLPTARDSIMVGTGDQ